VRLDQTYKELFTLVEDYSYQTDILDIREEIRYRVLAFAGKMKSRWHKIELKYPPAAGNISLHTTTRLIQV